MRKITEDGPAYGWLHLRATERDGPLWSVEVLGWSIDTRPNVPAVIGQPAPLVITTRTDGDRLVLGWNGFLPNSQLQSASTPDSSTWTEVTGVRQNTISLPIEDTARYYRLIHLDPQ
jgi:hypothetical protein